MAARLNRSLRLSQHVLRHRLDIVLFTLLHETAHIVRGDLEKYGGSIIDDEDQPHTLGDEGETDKLAAHWMLPSWSLRLRGESVSNGSIALQRSWVYTPS